jgi:hypothetical protein
MISMCPTHPYKEVMVAMAAFWREERSFSISARRVKPFKLFLKSDVWGSRREITVDIWLVSYMRPSLR